ncbi:MAG: DUF4830 domain-containing protein [Clostridia bacterium]|nr:DUF4830 domain-containing protein [Clostridia bacterium]
MFILTTKLSPTKLLAISLAVVTLVLGVVFLALPKNDSVEASASMKVRDAQDVRTFLSSKGWETSVSGSNENVTIPTEWNDIFETYNRIQVDQGYDLQKLKGKEVTRYTFQVTNYPDQNETVLANVLVYKGKIVGGDLSTTRADGYMHGFSLPDEQPFDTPTDAEVESVAETEVSADPIPEK